MKSLQNLSVDIKILLTAGLYYLSAEFAFLLAMADRASLPFWPAAGVAFAMVVIFGKQVWPGIAIGSLIFTVRNFWFAPIEDYQVVVLVSTLITMARIAEALVAAMLLKKLVPDRHAFSRTLDSFYFVGITLVTTLGCAGVSALVLIWTGVISEANQVNGFVGLWARDIVGILLFTPLILSLSEFKWHSFTIAKAGELAILAVVFTGMILLFNLVPLVNVFQYALPFAIIPFVLWLAFRFGDVVLMVSCLAVSLAAIYMTTLNVGPFYLPDSTVDSTLLLQIYLVVVNVTAIVLSSSVREREEAQATLKRFNENLETIVTRRTVALKEQIAQRAEAQLALQRMNDELIKRNEELDNFLYSTSHDLRAPISTILGLVNLARVDKGQNIKPMYLNMIEKATRQQDHFIREIIDQSQNRKGTLMREPIQLATVIDEAFGQLDIDEHGEYQKQVSIKQHEPFYCDRWRLQVILNNLLSNAIRYRNGHTPVVKIEARVDNRMAFLRIDDNGKGIAEEHLSKLGRMFYRATDEGAGSGLGLYIVRETLDRLSGSINIESRVGEGTSVLVQIPELVGEE